MGIPGPTSADSQQVTITLVDHKNGEEFPLTLKVRQSAFEAAALVELQRGLPPLPENEAKVGVDRLQKQPRCSVLQFRPITFAVNNLLISNKETLQMELRILIDSFNRCVKMVGIELHQPSGAGEYYKMVKVKLRDFWIDFTVEQFEIMVNAVLSTHYDQLSHITMISTGCFCASWIISPSYADLIKQRIPIKLSPRFLQIIGVISLHIGDDVIYNVGEEGFQTLEPLMLQTVELKNARAILELFLAAVGYRPEVATHNGDYAVTNLVNIRERSVDDGNEGGAVDHMCILEHNEAIIDTISSGEPECATCTKKSYACCDNNSTNVLFSMR